LAAVGQKGGYGQTGGTREKRPMAFRDAAASVGIEKVFEIVLCIMCGDTCRLMSNIPIGLNE
jgi:hypothetical protein